MLHQDEVESIVDHRMVETIGHYLVKLVGQPYTNKKLVPDYELPVSSRAAYQQQLYFLKKDGQVVVDRPQCKQTIQIYRQQRHYKRQYNRDFQFYIKTQHKQSQHWIYGDRVHRILQKVRDKQKSQYFKVEWKDKKQGIVCKPYLIRYELMLYLDFVKHNKNCFVNLI